MLAFALFLSYNFTRSLSLVLIFGFPFFGHNFFADLFHIKVLILMEDENISPPPAATVEVAACSSLHLASLSFILHQRLLSPSSCSPSSCSSCSSCSYSSSLNSLPSFLLLLCPTSMSAKFQLINIKWLLKSVKPTFTYLTKV